MVDRYIRVSRVEGGDTILLYVDDDGTISASTLQHYFPGTIPLKFRDPVSNEVVGVNISDDRKFHPPRNHAWGSVIYFCESINEQAPAIDRKNHPSKYKRWPGLLGAL